MVAPAPPAPHETPEQVRRAEEIAGRVHEVGSVPDSFTRILTLASQPEAETEALYEAIARDPAVTLRVIRSAGTVPYLGGRHVCSFDRAASLLGFRMIQQIAMTTIVLPSIEIDSLHARLKMNDLQRHCQAVAAGAAMLAEETGAAHIGNARTAGLLHEIGLLAELRAEREALNPIFRRVEHEGVTLRAAEVEAIGTTHEQIGRALCQRWGLPAALINPICYHHRPERSDDPLTLMVHVADILASRAGMGYLGNAEAETVADWVKRRLGLDDTALAALETRLPQEVESGCFFAAQPEAPSRTL